MCPLLDQFVQTEAGARRLQQRRGDVPLLPVLVTRLMMMISREFSVMMDQRLRPLGLNDIEFRTLLWLHSYPDGRATPGELGTCLSQSPANVTRLTDILLERGLIVREPDDQDRRRLILHITAQGAAAVDQVMPVMSRNVRGVYDGFADAELEQLLGSLKHIAQAIDHHASTTDPEPAP